MPVSGAESFYCSLSFFFPQAFFADKCMPNPVQPFYSAMGFDLLSTSQKPDPSFILF